MLDVLIEKYNACPGQADQKRKNVRPFRRFITISRTLKRDTMI
jgi:hypothetical protein